MKAPCASVLIALVSLACGAKPDAVLERSSATASASASAAQTATSAASAGATAATADPCAEAQKTVVAEAAKAADCKADADCKVHSIVLCHLAELDCYAAHVNKSSNTADLDQAVSAYVKSCPPPKCRCEMPKKSVCSNGKCRRG